MIRTFIAVSAILSCVSAAGASAAPAQFDPFYRTYMLGCVAETRPNASDKIGEFVITNSTPHVIPRGAKITITYLTRGGSKGTFVYDLHKELRPGQSFEFNQQYRDNRCLAVSVTFPRTPESKTDIPKMFEEKPRPPVKEYSRIRPPGPPQPGLLETNPEYSPQSPSGMGTPTKPSAPPPPPSTIR